MDRELRRSWSESACVVASKSFVSRVSLSNVRIESWDSLLRLIPIKRYKKDKCNVKLLVCKLQPTVTLQNNF